MKWVKASERLPEEKKLVCMRGDGGGAYHYQTAKRVDLIEALEHDKDIHHKYNPEWLDESESGETQVLKDELQKIIEQWEKQKADCLKSYQEKQGGNLPANLLETENMLLGMHINQIEQVIKNNIVGKLLTP